MKYWIGVVTEDHVRHGVELGIVQIGHGKHAGLARLHQGDGFVYYSPKSSLSGGQPVQAFTAIGTVPDEHLWQADEGEFRPWRRKLTYATSHNAPIRPLLDRLSITAGNPNWGYRFRLGLIEISKDDYEIIAAATGAKIDPM